MIGHRFLSIVAAALAVAATACSTTMPAAPSSQKPPAAPTADPIKAASTARYRVTFTATWSAQSHPVDFPATAHFSPLVGGTHTARVAFWQDGTLATDGEPLNSSAVVGAGSGNASVTVPIEDAPSRTWSGLTESDEIVPAAEAAAGSVSITARTTPRTTPRRTPRTTQAAPKWFAISARLRSSRAAALARACRARSPRRPRGARRRRSGRSRPRSPCSRPRGPRRCRAACRR